MYYRVHPYARVSQSQNQRQYPIASISNGYSARASTSVTDENANPSRGGDAERRCPKCNEQVKLKSWNRHKNYTCRVEPLKQSICPHCSMMFSRPDSLTRHLEESQNRCLENQAKRDEGTLRTEVRHRSKHRTSESSCDDVTNSAHDATTVLAPTQPQLPSSNTTVNAGLVVPLLPVIYTPTPWSTTNNNSTPVCLELPISYEPQPATEAPPVSAPPYSPIVASTSMTVTTTALVPSASHPDDDPVIPSSSFSLLAASPSTFSYIPYIPYNPRFAKEEEEAFTDADFDCFK